MGGALTQRCRLASGNLSSVEAAVDTVAGEIRSSWAREGANLTLELGVATMLELNAAHLIVLCCHQVSIPPNTVATVTVPCAPPSRF